MKRTRFPARIKTEKVEKTTDSETKKEEQTMATEKTTETEKTEKTDKTIEQQHKEFRDSLQPETEIKAEPLPGAEVSPMSHDRIISDAVKNKVAVNEKTGTETIGASTPAENKFNTAAEQKINIPDETESQQQFTNGFEAEKPPEPEFPEAETQKIDNSETTSSATTAGPAATSAFTIPASKTTDGINQLAAMINYAIGKFGKPIFGIKIQPSFYKLKKQEGGIISYPILEEVESYNTKAVEKLKFTDEEIKMIREPLVEMLGEDGIKGLSSQNKLILALGIVITGKVMAIIEIKKDGKKLLTNIDKKLSDFAAYLDKKGQKLEDEYIVEKTHQPPVMDFGNKAA